jgi:hypothetical protein
MASSSREPAQIDLGVPQRIISLSKRVAGGQGFKFVNYSPEELQHRRIRKQNDSKNNLLFLNMSNSHQPQFVRRDKPSMQDSASSNLTFLSTNPSSQEQRKLNQFIIRSQVMKRFWRKSKTTRPDITDTPRENEDRTDNMALANAIIETITDALIANHPENQPAPSAVIDSLDDINWTFLDSPSNVFGAGSVDPFGSYPCNRESSFVPEMIQYRELNFFLVE